MDLADTTLSEHKTDPTILCSCNCNMLRKKSNARCSYSIGFTKTGRLAYRQKATLSQGSSLRQRLRLKKHLLAGAKKPRRVKRRIDHEMVIILQQLINLCDHSMLQEMPTHLDDSSDFRVRCIHEWIYACIVTVNLHDEEDNCPQIVCGICWLPICSAYHATEGARSFKAQLQHEPTDARIR